MSDPDAAPAAVMVTWTTVDRDNEPVCKGRSIIGRGCVRCALDVGSAAMGLPDLIDPDYPPSWVPAHADDCGVVAIEDAAEAAGEEPDFSGDWPLR